MKCMFTGRNVAYVSAGGICVALVGLWTGCSGTRESEGVRSAASDASEVAVTTCDGTGQAMVSEAARGQEFADALMDQWQRDHPDRDWVAEEKERHELRPAADNSALLKGGGAPGNTYGRVTEQDLVIWSRETEKFVVEGSRIFHNAGLLGSTMSVSCDMCHPHAANTHPETYPKFQAQLGRAVLLRDMINWCIEHPVRGKRLEADDPRMRALEAYIAAQRSGTTMAYGKN